MSKKKSTIDVAWEGGRTWQVYREPLEHMAEQYLIHQAAQQLRITDTEASHLITREMITKTVAALQKNENVTVEFESDDEKSER